MAKFKVSVDLSWIYKYYKQFLIESETASKAKYKVAKYMRMDGKDFHHFINLFNPICKRLSEDSETGYYIEIAEIVENEIGTGKFTTKKVLMDEVSDDESKHK